MHEHFVVTVTTKKQPNPGIGGGSLVYQLRIWDTDKFEVSRFGHFDSEHVDSGSACQKGLEMLHQVHSPNRDSLCSLARWLTEQEIPKRIGTDDGRHIEVWEK